MNEYKLFEAEPADWIVNVACNLQREARASLLKRVYLKSKDEFIKITAEMTINEIVELYQKSSYKQYH